MLAIVNRTKMERLAPLIAGVCLALPTLLSRYLPMSDLPLHEGAIGLLRHFGDPVYMPEGLYRLNLGHPNQLFHCSAALLAFVFSTSTAVRIVVAAAQILMFVAGARLADYLGRSRWSVLLLAPLALGFTYYWGLVANLIGFAGFLLALPTLDRAARKPSLRGMLASCGVLLALYFAHESIFVCTALVVGIFTVLLPLSPKKTAMRIAPAVFAAAVAFGHLLWQKQFFTAGQMKAPVSYMTGWGKIRFFPNVLFGSYDLVEQLILLATAFIAIGLMLSARLREKTPNDAPAAESVDGDVPTDRVRRIRAKLYEHRFEVVAALHLIAYFAVPFNWNGATLVHERFLGPAWAIFVIAASPRGEFPRLGKVVNAVVPIGILLLAWPQFVDANRTYSDLDVLIAKIPKGSAVTQTALDKPIYKTRVYSASTAPARIIAEVGGRIGVSLLISPISPVQLRPEWQWSEYDKRTTYLGSKTLKPAHDLEYFEWVVAQSRDPFTRDLIMIALSPEADFVVAKGEWLLFHSRKKILPLKTHEVPAPQSMETALDRVYDLAHRHEDELREKGVPYDMNPTRE